MLCDLHADQYLIIRIVSISIVDFPSLEKAVEDATEGLHLIDRFHFSYLFIMLPLPSEGTTHHLSNSSAAY